MALGMRLFPDDVYADLVRPAQLRAGRGLIDGAIHALTSAGKLAPDAVLGRLGVHITHNVPYRNSGSPYHHLDVYRPKLAPPRAPALVYIHGGGFTLCSKDTHWRFALSFAERGFVVFNLNYRLAPMHKYPAAPEDVCDALLWVKENGHLFGADPSEMVVAGESAGGNLTTVAAVATSYRLGMPAAQRVFDSGLRLKAAIASCGVLQVSDMARFWRRKPHTPKWLRDQLVTLEEIYLPQRDARPGQLPLADPLVVIEEKAPLRELPPVFTFAGTRDPLLHDSKRMKSAYDGYGLECEYRDYPDELHAFHALPWKAAARQCWHEQTEFLARHVQI